ncbi:MAG: FecR domain-containing protein [Pirellulaceae bacterium]|jgi:hypothetical protein|nr:FecR domain-containing protein [Pirellulaceae bacterium]MDP7018106.1 FecR domain-containing protein [Pirellulaceae bacterium]
MNERLPELSDLISRFVDDRDALSEEELAQLTDHLRQSPQQLERLKDQLLLDEHLAQSLAVDRRNFTAQVDQRIRDLDRPTDIRAQVDDMRDLAASEWDQWREQTLRGGPRRHWFMITLTLLLLASLAVGVGTRPWWGSVVTVDQVAGQATFMRDGVESPLAPSIALYRGDGVATSPTGFVRLRYSDGTELEVRGSTKIELGRPALQKTVTITRGLVSATVASQPAGRAMVFYTPLANATVLGTELFLFVRSVSTRLDVTEGVVEFGRVQTVPLQVRANEYCVATQDRLVRRKLQWPSSRAGLVLLADSGKRDGPQWRVFNPSLDERMTPIQVRGESRAAGHRFIVDRGAFLATSDTSNELLERCRQSNQLTLEAMVQPNDLASDSRQRIVSFGGARLERNFALIQRQGQLLFFLRTSAGVREIELVRFTDRRRRHVVVSYRPGQLACYLDGRLVYAGEVTGELSNWGEHYLVLGDAWDGAKETQWSGELTGVAVYGRFLDEAEAHRNYRAFLSLSKSARISTP